MASEPIDVRTLTPEEIAEALEWLERRPTPIFADPQKNTVLALAKTMAKMLKAGPVGIQDEDGYLSDGVPFCRSEVDRDVYALPTPEEP